MASTALPRSGRGGGGVLLVDADQTTAAAGRAVRRESGPSGAERRQLHSDRQRGSELQRGPPPPHCPLLPGGDQGRASSARLVVFHLSLTLLAFRCRSDEARRDKVWVTISQPEHWQNNISDNMWPDWEMSESWD